MLADLLVKVNLIKEANYISGYNPADNDWVIILRR
jgi:hypothetical protein